MLLASRWAAEVDNVLWITGESTAVGYADTVEDYIGDKRLYVNMYTPERCRFLRHCVLYKYRAMELKFTIFKGTMVLVT
jgi:hypothetical protein